MTRALWLLAVLWACGCSKSDPKATPSAKPEELEVGPLPHACLVTATQYDVALTKGSDVCQGDADCACYQGGIGKSGCGGVLNKDSVAKSETFAKRYHAAKCPLTTQCAPWVCQPKCVGGRCRP